MLSTMLDSRTSSCCALAILLLSSVSVASAEDRSAYVLDVRGQWRIESTLTDLARADVVRERSRIRHLAGSQQDYIVLGGLWNTPKRFSCSQPKGCEHVYEIVSAANEESRATQIYSAVMEIWRGQESWDEGFSRGIELKEGILGLRNGALLLSSMFSGLPQDSYHLRIRRIERGMDSSKFTEISNSITYDWNPDHPAPLAMNDIRPGLYEIGLMSPGLAGQYEYSGISGWALVCDRNLSWCEESFGRATSLTKGWGDAVRPIVRRNFLRAYLQTLSQEAK